MTLHLPSTEAQGLRLIQYLFCNNHRIFTTKKACSVAKELQIPSNQVNIILSRLTKQGVLSRIRRGLYVSVGILGEVEKTSSFVISCYMGGIESAISHLSALNYHGLTEQIPHVITASTTTFRYIGKITIKEIHYQYITIQKKHFFGIETLWITPHFKVQITDKERTILDLFIYSKMFGGMGEALGILEDSLDEIDINKLVEYAIRYNEKTTIKRLGWALEQFEVPASFLQPLLESVVSSYCLLDPEKIAAGPYEKRWMIQNNLKQEYKK